MYSADSRETRPVASDIIADNQRVFSFSPVVPDLTPFHSYRNFFFPSSFPACSAPRTMWRRTYLLLLLLRVYFALSPSYLHPDENFQGPEVFAGKPAMRLPCDPDDCQFVTRFLALCLAFFLGDCE